MLAPEPMLHVSLVTLERDLETVARAIAEVGVLHLLDIRQSPDTPPAIRPYDVSPLLARLDALGRAVAELAAFLGVDTTDAIATATGAAPDLAQAEARIGEIRAEADALREQRAAALAELERLSRLEHHLRALAPLGAPLEDFRDLRYVRLVSGLVPARNLPRLRESLAAIPHLLAPAGPVQEDGRVFMTAACLQPEAEVLERALRGAHVEPVEIPAHLEGTPETLLAALGREAAAQRRTLDEAEAARRALGRKRGAAVRELAGRIARERLLLEARSRMGHTERVALVRGWVPASVAGVLEAAVRWATDGRCVVRWAPPAAVDAVRRGLVKVPILLRNPVLVRPFERLVRTYGLPEYGEVEPTAILAVTFLLMFGFMFGDVGQGAVLFALGLLVYRRRYRHRDYAIILMECGVAAAVFGFLYGSVFGVEHWLPPLWLNPREDLPLLIRTAVAFGALLLSLGLALNLWNAWRRRDVRGLWERNGLLAAVAYWTGAGLFLRWLVAGPDAVTAGMALLWLSPPLALIFLKEPALAVWREWRAGRRPDPGEIVTASVQAAVEVLDTVVTSVSNTATFIRLAAFALAHAGLFLATFSLASTVAASAAGTAGAALVLVAGNVLMIALEGLIVFIQAVRLEYYEFFSRFHSGGGEEYRPLRLSPTPTGPF